MVFLHMKSCSGAAHSLHINTLLFVSPSAWREHTLDVLPVMCYQCPHSPGAYARE